MPATRRTTEAELVKADQERFHQVFRIAMAESGPYPDDDAPMWVVRKWVNRVNRLAREIGNRLN